ncbi:2-acyl-glycerophospho-ethanolamine acyltransferase [Pseudovibrio axinellae]|uniref:2-acyl-glycerophospho-ethanolamine acyltransferase n=1 Tax=Pseudovibrio axinellae TaxID=989403 RepID=A0A165YBC4_9HYPH|nr:MFS transporter [Pseudovibrio axinellae]KZL18636.1 2-acyl-glycerophospho-ethanolamine acyltransferase [Pseudovibrio axinellae]SER73776.1 Predicted arabinose efflux permease, MFS family [Pseudovibrio axinellae]
MQGDAVNTSILALFKLSAFRRFVGVIVPAAFADWIDFIAIMALVSYSWGMGASEVSAVLMAVMLPRVVFGLPAGVLVDRFGAGPVLILGLFIRAAVMLSMFFFAQGLWTLLALVFLKATVSATFMPAQQLAIKKLVPSNMLTQAVSVDHFVIQSTKLFAPLVGGALLAIYSAHHVFLLSSTLFSLAALICIFLLSPLGRASAGEQTKEEQEQVSILKESKAALVFIWKTPRLLLGMEMICLFIFSVFLYEAELLLLFKETGLREWDAGPIIGAIGVGGLVGTYLTAKIGDRVNLQMLMSIGLCLGGLATAVAGWLPFSPVRFGLIEQMGIWFFGGMFSSIIAVPYGAILVRQTPERLIGRVSSVGDMMQSGLTLLAIPIGAFLAELWFVSMPFFAGGMLMVTGGVAGLFVSASIARKPEVEQTVSQELV